MKKGAVPKALEATEVVERAGVALGRGKMLPFINLGLSGQLFRWEGKPEAEPQMLEKAESALSSAGFACERVTSDGKILRAWKDERKEPAARQYVTKAGDSVMGIALRELGDESRWREIVQANSQKFGDLMRSCDYYPVGTVLRLPKEEGSCSG